MADGTKIEWTEATWNPITGCTVVSPGCTNCYAMQLAGTRLEHHPSRAGLTRLSGGRPKWTGEVRFNESWLADPLKWKRARMIFVCAHGDLFHESVPDEWIDRVCAVMALCPQHTFQVLTKRPGRMREYVTAFVRGDRSVVSAGQELAEPGVLADALMKAVRSSRWATPCGPLPNVWLGVSIEDQQRADERIPDLLATPAAVRWLSCEPLLGPVDTTNVNGKVPEYGTVKAHGTDVLTPHNRSLRPQIDWIVVGGESGRGARPMHPDWARSLRDQCAAAGVPFFFKQWGAFRPCTEAELKQACGATLVGDRLTGAYMMPTTKKLAGRLIDGVEHDGFPEMAR